MNELKTIDFAEGKFTANGVTYFIETELSIKRATFADAAMFQLETGMELGKQMEEWKEVYSLANEQKFADIVVKAYNNQRGFKNFFEQHHPVLKLCACYINEQDEDRREISDDMVNKKVMDWAEEGISRNSFFALALTLLVQGTKNYMSAAQTISDLVKEFNAMKEDAPLNISTSN